MDPEMAAGLFAEHPDLVMCGALNPQGRARRVAGGWRVSGQWPFASGCHHATFFWGQCVVEDSTVAASEPTRLIEVLVPRSSFEIVDTWRVIGLRGTGSHDVRVDDLFVPDAMITEVAGQRPNHDGALYRLPPFTRLAYNKVGVATGIARSALDAFVELAEHKQPRLSSRALRERPRAQTPLCPGRSRVAWGEGICVRCGVRCLGDSQRRGRGRPATVPPCPTRVFARLPGSDPCRRAGAPGGRDERQLRRLAIGKARRATSPSSLNR